MPCAVTSTEVAFASPSNTLVAICDTNAMNGDAMPMVRTITTNMRRITRWAIANRKPSASAPKIGRRSLSRRGTFTNATAMMTAKKLSALHHSAVPMPPTEIATAARDGPMILPRFHWAFDRPTPATRCSRGTRSGNVDWNEGNVNAPMQPATKLSAAMPSGVAVPPPTQTARTAATTADRALPIIRIRRLLHRSAIAEPIGPSTPLGRNPAAPTSADHEAFPVV